MGIKNVLASLSEKLQARERSAAEAYADLIERVAADKAVGIEVVEAALQAAGKTPDDLSQDVGKLQYMRHLEGVVATEPALTAERNRIAAAKDAEDQRFGELRAEHGRIAWQLECEQSELAPRIRAVQEARSRLAIEFPESKIIQAERAESLASARANELAAAKARLERAERELERVEQTHSHLPRVLLEHKTAVTTAEKEVAALESAA